MSNQPRDDESDDESESSDIWSSLADTVAGVEPFDSHVSNVTNYNEFTRDDEDDHPSNKIPDVWIK